jgi:hypothetical protein
MDDSKWFVVSRTAGGPANRSASMGLSFDRSLRGKTAEGGLRDILESPAKPAKVLPPPRSEDGAADAENCDPNDRSTRPRRRSELAAADLEASLSRSAELLLAFRQLQQRMDAIRKTFALAPASPLQSPAECPTPLLGWAEHRLFHRTCVAIKLSMAGSAAEELPWLNITSCDIYAEAEAQGAAEDDEQFASWISAFLLGRRVAFEAQARSAASAAQGDHPVPEINFGAAGHM